MKNNRSHFPAPLLGWILAISWLLGACTQQETPQANSGLELSRCLLTSPALGSQYQAQCGTVSVFENPAAGEGRKIDLQVAVLPAISRNPEPDPLVYLAGGPGQSATETYPLISQAFMSLRQNRDVVLVDQRGVGKSSPLVCPELEEEEESFEEPSEEDLQRYLEACLAGLDADVSLYTTANFVEDLEQVRQALGYEQFNLYGVSYGTRVALTYLQRHPESLRTVILDGVAPQDEILGLDVAADAQRALDLTLARCMADEACQAAFPNLEQETTGLLKELREQPAHVSIAHPNTGEQIEFDFTGEMLSNAIRLLTYTPETVALLPLLLHTSYTTGEYDLLALQYLIVVGDISQSINSALSYSIVCSEDAPFMTPEQAEQANQGTYLENTQTDGLFQVCSVWPRGEIPEDFKEPVHSDKPVLILSGENDPVTPPENAEHVAQTLPNHLHLVAPEQGHNIVYRGCLPRIVSDFVESGSVENLDITCVQDIQAMPFFISFSGPMP